LCQRKILFWLLDISPEKTSELGRFSHEWMYMVWTGGWLVVTLGLRNFFDVLIGLGCFSQQLWQSDASDFFSKEFLTLAPSN
jgi:hypothetical protein